MEGVSGDVVTDLGGCTGQQTAPYSWVCVWGGGGVEGCQVTG